MESEWKCTKHNLNFGIGKIEIGTYLPQCPLCAEEEIDRLRKRLGEVEGHRDLLLGAIELKLRLKLESA